MMRRSDLLSAQFPVRCAAALRLACLPCAIALSWSATAQENYTAAHVDTGFTPPSLGVGGSQFRFDDQRGGTAARPTHRGLGAGVGPIPAAQGRDLRAVRDAGGMVPPAMAKQAPRRTAPARIAKSG